MEIYIYAVIFLVTLVVMIILSKKTKQLVEICESNRIIREECDIDLELSIKTIWPNQILEPIENNTKIVGRDKSKIRNCYTSFLRYYLFFYFLFWVHVVYWIILIKNIVLQWGNWDEAFMPFRFAIIVMDVVISYCLYLTPIFEAFGKYKIAKIGPTVFNFFENISDFISRKVIEATLIIGEVVISALCIYGYNWSLRNIGYPQ